MKRKCVALLSGGLDSMIAVRLMQQQGIHVEALNFRTVFTCCQDDASRAAHDLQVPITVLGQQDDYLELVETPRFGYGRGANPCVDCRVYMFDKSKRFMEQVGADFMVSGEVVGQRPMSQKRRDLLAISYHSETEDLLLRPLSAKLLPPTLPEREGWVERPQLFAFNGRGRKELIRLARRLGIEHIPTPSTGCALTEPQFSRKVFDLIKAPANARRWDYDLLKLGRHFRLDLQVKVVVGRDETENRQLAYVHGLPDASSSALLRPANFAGPTALVIGPVGDDAVGFAGGLVLRYSSESRPAPANGYLEQDGNRRVIALNEDASAAEVQSLATGGRR